MLSLRKSALAADAGGPQTFGAREGAVVPRKVLVADDDRLLVGLLHEALEERGYQVLAAFDGMEALDQVRREAPTSSSWIASCRRWTGSRSANNSRRTPNPGPSRSSCSPGRPLSLRNGFATSGPTPTSPSATSMRSFRTYFRSSGRSRMEPLLLSGPSRSGGSERHRPLTPRPEGPGPPGGVGHGAARLCVSGPDAPTHHHQSSRRWMGHRPAPGDP